MHVLVSKHEGRRRRPSFATELRAGAQQAAASCVSIAASVATPSVRPPGKVIVGDALAAADWLYCTQQLAGILAPSFLNWLPAAVGVKPLAVSSSCCIVALL